MDGIKVSVIIPVYNMEIYLEECLRSVLAQTLQKIEVICVDDGSTDGSGEILNEYGKKYTNLKVFRQRNMGAGAARNKGMQLAEGAYIAFMDPDDLYPSDGVLQAIYEKAEENNAFICGGGASTYRCIDGVGQERIIADKSFQEEGWVSFRDYQYPYGFWRFLYQRDFLVEHEITFPLYRQFEDPLFMVRSFMAAEKFYALPMTVYFYRKEFFDTSFKKEGQFEGFLGRKEVLDFALEHDLPLLWKTVYNGFTGKRISLLYRWYIQEPSETKRVFEEIRRDGIAAGFMEDDGIEVFDLEEPGAEAAAYAENFYQTVNDYTDVIVYGAGAVGEEVIAFLRKYASLSNILIAVSSMAGNLSKLDGIPVFQIQDLEKMREDALVVIAVGEKNKAEVRNHLEKYGFAHVIEADCARLEMNEVFRMFQMIQKGEDRFHLEMW